MAAAQNAARMTDAEIAASKAEQDERQKNLDATTNELKASLREEEADVTVNLTTEPTKEAGK
jgi:hypothetical protein